MTRTRLTLIALATVTLIRVPYAQAQHGALREAGRHLTQAVARFAGKTTAKEGLKELADAGGEAAVRELGERLVREGGEVSLEQAARLTSRHGPKVLRAIDQAPSAPAILRALDELADDAVRPAIQRLAAGRQGRELADVVARFGAPALQAEVRLPGVGGRLVRDFGNDGIQLAARLDVDQATQLARHSQDIARLPVDLQSRVMRLLHDDTERMLRYLGRFVEQHPGKVLFTVAGTTFLLANSQRILEGDECYVDEQGNRIPQPSLVERGTRRVAGVFLPILAIGLSLWIAIRLWGTFRLQRLRCDLAEVRSKSADR